MSVTPILKRIEGLAPRDEIAFTLDGQACSAFEGDTVLTAILTQSQRLRESEWLDLAGLLQREIVRALGRLQDGLVAVDAAGKLVASIIDGQPIR